MRLHLTRIRSRLQRYILFVTSDALVTRLRFDPDAGGAMTNLKDANGTSHIVAAQTNPRASDYEKLLLERFPHVQQVSLQLLLQNAAFRELCEEYEVCNRTATNLANTGADPGMLQEYKALRLRLEGELLGYLSQSWKNSAAR